MRRQRRRHDRTGHASGDSDQTQRLSPRRELIESNDYTLLAREQDILITELRFNDLPRGCSALNTLGGFPMRAPISPQPPKLCLDRAKFDFQAIQHDRA